LERSSAREKIHDKQSMSVLLKITLERFKLMLLETNKFLNLKLNLSMAFGIERSVHIGRRQMLE